MKRRALLLAAACGPSFAAVPQLDALLRDGEAALRDGDVLAAQQAFERAAALDHDPAAEWGLVRSWMQAGAYRRALAFAAHAAGGHTELPEGAGLYAWLLFIGGQVELARQAVNDGLQRAPGHPLLVATARRLQDPVATPPAQLLEGATRQAPLANGAAAQGQVVASGVLLPSGREAWVPAAALPGGPVWLRDAFGRTRAARPARTLAALGLTELSLDTPLREVLPPWPVAARDAFPGSPEMAVGFIATRDAQPAWPLLRLGFVGRWEQGARYQLGAALPGGGAQGGPVYDGSGRLIGLALEGRLLAASALREHAPQAFTLQPDAPAQSPDAVYERAMTTVVQLIADPPR